MPVGVRNVLDSGGAGSELDAESLHDAKKSGEPGIASGRERLVESLARDAGLIGKLGHSDGALDVAQGGGDQGGVAVVEGGLETGVS